MGASEPGPRALCRRAPIRCVEWSSRWACGVESLGLIGSTPMTRRILVVDDDELLREVAQTALEIVGGWQVAPRTRGPRPSSRRWPSSPDAILLDVMMPGVDGPSDGGGAAGRSGHRADIPIIFLTAKMPSERPEEWRALRLAGVIPKPFDPMTLAADMARLLGWQEVTTRMAVQGEQRTGRRRGPAPSSGASPSATTPAR